MKKLATLLVLVLAAALLLTGCTPKMPDVEEAAAIAKEHLDAVIQMFDVASYELDNYTDGAHKEYMSNEKIYYKVANFDDLYAINHMTDDQTVAAKNALGLRITKNDGTFILADTYDQLAEFVYGGVTNISVDKVADNQIFCTVTVSCGGQAKEFPLVLHRYLRQVPGEDGKMIDQYYWRISQMFDFHREPTDSSLYTPTAT